jgi:hypothetical protein
MACLVPACASETETNQNAPAKGETSLEGSNSCVVTATTPVAWTATTPLGTPEQLFAHFAGTCQAPFTWDGSGWVKLFNLVNLSPPSGNETLTTTVAIDTATARLIDRKANNTQRTGTPQPCGHLLEVDATVSLSLPSGIIANKQKVTLAATSDKGPATVTLTLPEAQFGTWITVEKIGSTTSLGMQIELEPVGKMCAGRIGLEIQNKVGNIGGVTFGFFASWTDSGCPVTTTAVSLDTPCQGANLRDTIAHAFGQATIPGQWSTGEATTLNLSATPSGAACTASNNRMNVVTIPVAIQASTSDARIQGLVGTGTINVYMADTGGPQLQLDFSLPQSCASTTEKLVYTPIDCAVTETIKIQLHLHQYLPDSSQNGGSISIYVNQRGDNPSLGASEIVTLILTPS